MARQKGIRILYIAAHWPRDFMYGAQERVLHVGRLLQKLGDVSMVIVTNERVDSAVIDRSRSEFNIVKVVTTILVNHSLVGRIRHELDPSYLLTDRFTIAQADKIEILKLLDEYDLVWVHTVKTANSLGIAYFPHSVLDIDDIPSSLYDSSWKTQYRVGRRLLDLRMRTLWRRRERSLAKRFSVLTVCSEEDRHYFGNGQEICVLPNGFKMPQRSRRRRVFDLPRLGFVGLLNYYPNVDGVKWFISEVWPLIRMEIPQARLRLVGKGSETFSHEPDIEGLGWVEDTDFEMSTWAGMIVPLRIGGGTRIKIAEAFARRCPVVSTSLGAFGYEVRDKEHLTIANGAAEFARGCVAILRDRHYAEHLASKAHELFRLRWIWDLYEPIVERAVFSALSATRNNR